VGNSVDCIVDTVGIENGTKATVTIFVRDGNYADHQLASLEAAVSSNKIQSQWTLQVDGKLLKVCDAKEKKKKYSLPFFFFRVTIAHLSEQSSLLLYKDYTELIVKDDRGNTIGNKKYKAFLPSGEIKEGTLDGQGHAKIENVPPGRVNISVDLKS
jgi:hypothetical protein